MASKPIVDVDHLSKSYGDVHALKDCNIAVDAGEVFGLLGPNGSGKSTLLRILMGMVRPTNGSARILGHDCWHDSVAARRHAGYLPGDARLFSWSRGRDVLALMASARADMDETSRRSIAIAERLQLDLNRRVGMMSTGMRQKLAIAITMAAETPVLILDEPTANLDPTVRMEVLQMVLEAKASGQTILFSSHVLSETEEVSDRVLLLRYGDQIHLQDMRELRRGHRVWMQPPERFSPQDWLPRLGNGPFNASTIEQEEEWIRVDVESDLPAALRWLSNEDVAALKIEPMGLKTVYEEHFGAVSRFHKASGESTLGLPMANDSDQSNVSTPAPAKQGDAS